MSNQHNNSYDAGFFEYGSIGDFVWNDLNANGIQDQNEKGIGGIKILLNGIDGFGNTGNQTTISNMDGYYIFENLNPGEYTLFVDSLPANYTFTNPDIGLDDNLDSDALEGFVSGITISGGQADRSRDFGLVKSLDIGDYIWEDKNSNGIQDIGEMGIGSVNISLKGIDFKGENVQMNTVSDSFGKYLFKNIYPGKYTITLEIPLGFCATKSMIGSDRNIDSNLSENDNTFTFEIGEATSDLSFDFGLIKFGMIGDFVWEDLNGDGIFQDGEPGIEGVMVTIEGMNIFSSLIQKTTTTDNKGKYIFEELKPGTYTTTFKLPAGFEFSKALVNIVELASGQSVLSQDAPMYRRASIGDFVWDDQNGNGIQEVGEPGISGVVVRLNSITSPSSPPLETTTNANGIYSFDNLKPGLYSISFGKVSDYQITTLRAGTDTTKDNDADTNGLANNISLISGMSRTDIDAGYVSTSTAGIGDFVWEDLNGNGMQDDGEPGLEGVMISLTGTSLSGKAIAENTTSDGNGKYLFDKLPAGTYKIIFSKPGGYNYTDRVQGNNNTDSDADVTTGETRLINLAIGQKIDNIDAGLYRRASIGDFVWDDQNGNGIQGAGEPGISGVVVRLNSITSLSSPPLETTTNANGIYSFDNLKPGLYSISFGKVSDYQITTLRAGTDTTKTMMPIQTDWQIIYL
ncbi:MAG: carboxypeptidase regulatory-like domain-containing protein [Saprospiraceae bacterium]|nr:carboxypeptidase regulatory-like domain-containing protein [Saprospiraceae bacterium]